MHEPTIIARRFSSVLMRMMVAGSVVAVLASCTTDDGRNSRSGPRSSSTQSIPASKYVRDLPPPIKAVVDSINNGDASALVAAFTPDGVIDDWGRVLRGPRGIASWAETDAIGQNARIAVTAATTNGAVTEIKFDWRSNRFNGESHAFVTIADDKVREFRIPSS